MSVQNYVIDVGKASNILCISELLTTRLLGIGKRPLLLRKVGLRLPLLLRFIGGSLRRGILSIEGGDGVYANGRECVVDEQLLDGEVFACSEVGVCRLVEVR